MLCDCPMLEEARVRNWNGAVVISMMVDEPEICRKILAHRFTALSQNKQNEQ